MFTGYLATILKSSSLGLRGLRVAATMEPWPNESGLRRRNPPRSCATPGTRGNVRFHGFSGDNSRS